MIDHSDIPDNWDLIPLVRLSTTTSGGTPRRSVKEYFGGEYPWIKSGELNDDLIYNSEETITQEALNESNAKLMPIGTLLIAMYGATVGKLGKLGIEAATNQAICAISTENVLDTNYLFWFLRSYRNELVRMSYGGAQPNISQNKIRNILVPLPFPNDLDKSLREQRRIVARIESLFAEVEHAKKLHNSIVEDTEQLMPSALNELIPNPYSSKANGFSFIPLIELTTERNQQITPAETPEKEFNYWGLDAINAGEFQEPAINIVKGNEIASSNITFFARQVLYCKLRPYLNKVISTTMEGIGSTEWVVFQPKTKLITSDYLANVMRSQWFVNTIMRSTTGARMPRARKSVLREMLIPVPSKVETEESLYQQYLIVKKIETINKQVRDIRKTLDNQVNEFESLQQSILSQAFKGEL